MPNTITLSAVNAILLEMSALKDIDQDQFLNHVIQIVHSHIDIYFMRFFLLDLNVNDDGQWVVLRAGTHGEATDTMLCHSHRLQVGTAVLTGRIKLTGENTLIYSLPTESGNSLDIKFEADQGPSYYSPLLPKTTATLSLPLRFQGEFIGTWQVDSSKKDGIEFDSIIHFQLLADQIAMRLCSLQVVT